jgi:hypothetical protein
VKKLLYLTTVALVAMLILVPTAMAQTEVTIEEEVKMEATQPLPASGGPVIGAASVVLPAAALLLGTGIVGYAILRRR